VVKPIFTANVAAIRQSAVVFLVRTPVIGGGPTDYVEYEMFDQGEKLGILHAWSLRSIRACVGGDVYRLMEQSAFAPGDVGTVEFAINVGHMNEPLSSYAMYGFGHGHMSYAGVGILMDGGPANYRGPMPESSVLRGNSFMFDSSYRGNLPDGLPVTAVNIAHIFTTDGLRIAQAHKVIADGCGMQNSYSAMLPATNCDRVSAGGPVLVVGKGNGEQIGNWGRQASFSLWNASRPGVRLEMALPYGSPSDAAGSWDDCQTSQTFLLDNPLNQKLYVNCRSGTAGQAFTGQHNYLADYSVRKV
jgi:hypothetical protein